MRSSVQFLWRDSAVPSGFRAGVSLHSHTMHSREGLGFLPRYARRLPLINWEFERQKRHYQAVYGRDLDFSKAYWTPPLPGREAFEVERRQIEEVLGLRAMVSLTDHDNIEAGSQLQALDLETPLSVEWTIPFGDTYFHLGVHNLPPQSACNLMAALGGYTRCPEAGLLRELLARLDADPAVLLVLNHPVWDLANIGAARHRVALRNLLESVGDWIHALELNGFRTWGENRAVIDLARELGRTLVAGGDRHGREPNVIVNLTNAAGFAEFVEEVRSGSSHLLFLPSYREPLGLRVLKVMSDILRYSPDLAGRERWTDRIYYSPRGEPVPVSCAWKNGGPAVVQWFVRGVELAGSGGVRRALRPWRIEDHEFER